VEKYFDVIRHVHVNEMDGGHPGTGNYDFPAFARSTAAPRLPRLGIARGFRLQPGAEKNRQ